MKERVSIRNVLGLTTISQDSSWKTVYEWILNNVDEKDGVELDFTNVQLQNPCSKLYEHFAKILELDYVDIYISGYNETAVRGIVNAINMKCIIDGYKTNRARAEVFKTKPEPTKEDKMIERSKNLYISQFVLDGHVWKFKYMNNNVTGSTSVNAIAKCIEEIHDRSKGCEFFVDFGDAGMFGDAVEKIAYHMVNFDKQGINLEVNINNPTYVERLKLFIYAESNEQKSVFDRLNIMLGIPENTAGLLIKYKSSRAVDEFGRIGKGEAVYSKVAIFRGMVDKSFIPVSSKDIDVDTKDSKVIDKMGRLISPDRFVAVFDIFNDSTFLTPDGILSNNDGNMVVNNKAIYELPCERVEASIEAVGIYNDFLGSTYQFVKPIQTSSEETRTVIVGMTEDGVNIKRRCNLPERMEVVFDSWGIEYNKEELNKCKKAVVEKFGETEQ